MCLSSVYEINGNSEQLICEHAASISIDGATITLTDILGKEIVVSGHLKNIDLAKNIIKIAV